MSKITDINDLVLADTIETLGQQGNIFIDVPNNKIIIKEGLQLGPDGVQLQTLYSFLKYTWKINQNYIKYSFPMEGITPEQFEFINGWELDQSSIKYIRDGGFAFKDNQGQSTKEYCSVITLGDISQQDQVYFSQDGIQAIDFILGGPVNQCILILDTSINFDRRTQLKLYVREYKKSYASTDLIDIGVDLLQYKTYRFSLENQIDLKITSTDNQIQTGVVYQGMQVLESGPVTRTIDGVDYPFNKIIDVGGSFPQAEEIYEFIQWYLRQPVNKLKPEHLEFIGDSLKTSKGIFIDGFALSDINRIEFTDSNNTIRKYPFISTLTILFNDILVQDSGSTFSVFFTNNLTSQFNNQSAIVVNDSKGIPIQGNITGPKLQFSFDYDNNTQGGRIPSTTVPITVVAMGLEKAQYITVEGTIDRSNTNSILLSANLERNYSN